MQERGSGSMGMAKLAARYAAVRGRSLSLCEGLSAEDMNAQSMPDASPVKWHLAHTTWFFDAFVLRPLAWDGRPSWADLFSSDDQGLGRWYPREKRGALTRPGVGAVLEYRKRVDEAMFAQFGQGLPAEFVQRIIVGLEHEGQHQELMLTDLKHLFAQNPFEPAYRPGALPSGGAPPLQWLHGANGMVDIGSGDAQSLDNERPRHALWLQPYQLANRPVTNGEYRDFIRDGGYRKPQLWLANGWTWVQTQQVERPLYWGEDFESEFSLRGRIALNPDAPVCHLNLFEADAFARWAGARLPTEAEWEAVAATMPRHGHGLEQELWHPVACEDPRPRHVALQCYGEVWEWTASAYQAYPGYRPSSNALGDDSGKFMCGQWVLRGGSCVTPASQRRPTYRHFLYPGDRWQFSGLRLAKDA